MTVDVGQQMTACLFLFMPSLDEPTDFKRAWNKNQFPKIKLMGSNILFYPEQKSKTKILERTVRRIKEKLQGNALSSMNRQPESITFLHLG